MYVFTVICITKGCDYSVDLYHNYDDSFEEAQKLMLMEIERIYGNNIVDDEGVKLQDYPDILHNNRIIAIGNIVTGCMYIEIIRKEVQ